MYFAINTATQAAVTLPHNPLGFMHSAISRVWKS